MVESLYLERDLILYSHMPCVSLRRRQVHSYKKNHLTTKNTLAKKVAVSAAAILMLGQSDRAQSAVFEQTGSGKVFEVTRGARTVTVSDAKRHLTKSLFRTEAAQGRHNEPLATDTAIVDTDIFVTDGSADGNVEVDSYPPLATSTSSTGPRGQKFLPVPLSSPSLPKPRSMSTSLSRDQWHMYWLAGDFGRRFASTVRKSNLGKARLADLFTAVIQRESNFNPRAVSAAGAMGLGQLMPGTALQLGVQDPFSARHNLRGAATYLTKLLDEFGSPELALAAYNAGPGAVRKFGGIPPYRETRQYVSDILYAIGVKPNNIALQITRVGTNTPSRLRSRAPADDAQGRVFQTVLQ
ncbi:lytic transglycosylase domain-containing protein [Sinorhizobium meliloti]|nr:lytic transglycosylase domain-containing protein [Sinorhizobium meliloti]